MIKTFFSVMQAVQKDIDRGVVDKSSEALFSRLVSVVEECGFSKSKTTKFVCRHWNLPIRELTSIWLQAVGGSKSPTTIRSHASVTGKQLFELFGNIQPSTFGNPLDLSDEDIALRVNLDNVLSTFEVDDVYASNVFINEVLNYFEDSKTDSEYSVEECKEELGVLKLLLKPNIYGLLDTLDSDKLKYVLSVLKKPLTNNMNRCANTKKLEFLKAMNLIESSYDSLVVAAAQEGSGVSEELVKEVQPVQPKKHRFKLGVTNEMAEILEERLAQKSTDAERANASEMDERMQRSFKVLHGTLNAMTPDGFRKYLARQNSILLHEVVNGEYEGFKWIDGDYTDATKEEKALALFEKNE